MKRTKDQTSGVGDNNILFTKTVKAGARVYYVDVRSDRREECYLTITESKRVWDNEPGSQPVFEKHKLFLYREDLERFMEALDEAVDFAVQNTPEQPVRGGLREASCDEAPTETDETDDGTTIGDIKIDLTL